MSNAIRELEEKVILKAVKLIDEDKLAKKMAKKLESEIMLSYEQQIQDIDLHYWITHELENRNTVAGKLFHKTMSKIAKRMIDSIETND